MESAISTAARALSVGDPLRALTLVALRNDPAALALRGIAMAQLGELAHARRLLGRAAAGFGKKEALARARCVVAQAEVALAARDLRGAAHGLSAAIKTLARGADVANAVHGRLIEVRRLVLLGRTSRAERLLQQLALTRAPSRLVALANLIGADIAMKGLRSSDAELALERARQAARDSRIVALVAEVERARERLQAPMARLVTDGTEQILTAKELESLFHSDQLLVDACRRELRQGPSVVSLLTRPLLVALLLALAESSPHEVPRERLIQQLFGAQRQNESHRVRLRVEIGRLRKLVAERADVRATPGGFALLPHGGSGVAVLLPPGSDEASALGALLHGGEAWSTSALAAALGKSQRSVQRALAELEAAGKVRASGAGRARRWVVAPGAGFATTLLLAVPSALG